MTGVKDILYISDPVPVFFQSNAAWRAINMVKFPMALHEELPIAAIAIINRRCASNHQS